MRMAKKRAWFLAAAGVAIVGAAAAAMMIWTPTAVLAWCGGILAAALVAYLSQDAPRQIGQALARRRERRERVTGIPVTYTARIQESGLCRPHGG